MSISYMYGPFRFPVLKAIVCSPLDNNFGTNCEIASRLKGSFFTALALFILNRKRLVSKNMCFQTPDVPKSASEQERSPMQCRDFY